jgi:hypothetical protein
VGSPVAQGSLAIDPTGTLLFAHSFGGTLYAFQVSGATLTAVTPNGFANAGAGGLLMDPVIPVVYAPEPSSTSDYAFSFSPSGALTAEQGPPVTYLLGSPFAAIDPAGENIFVSYFHALVQFNVDPLTGAVAAAAGSPFALNFGGFPENATLIDPSGRFLFIAAYDNTWSIVGFPLPITGSLPAQLPGSPITTPVSTLLDLTMPSAGGFLYQLGWASNENTSVSGFTVAANGSLAAIPGASQTVPSTANQASVLLEDSAGGWIAVASAGAPFVSMFPVQAGGSLGLRVDTACNPPDPEASGLAFDPPAGAVFVGEWYEIRAYSFDYATGTLTEAPGSPYPSR